MRFPPDSRRFCSQPIALRYLVHDRDGKFPAARNTVFAAEGIEVIQTPYRAPDASAYAERWVRSARQGCLGHLLILGKAHLRRVLAAYVAYYKQCRPHQGLAQRCPLPADASPGAGAVARRGVPGGLIHGHYREVVWSSFSAPCAPAIKSSPGTRSVPTRPLPARTSPLQHVSRAETWARSPVPGHP